MQTAPALPSPPGTLYTTSWGRPGVPSKSVAIFSSMTNPASVTRPSIATSMPTSWPLQSYTARRVAKRPADNATQVASAAAPSPIRSVSMRVPASWASEPALVTGRLTWLLVLDTSKPLSRRPERTSRYPMMAHVPFKTAQAVSDT